MEKGLYCQVLDGNAAFSDKIIMSLKYTYDTYGLKEVFRNIFYYPLRSLFFKLERIYDFSKVLWGVADFDWSSLLIVLEKQLRRLAVRLENGYGMTSPKQAKDVLICAELCKRILADDYDALLRQKQDEKWGASIWRREEIPDRPEFQRLILEREKAKEGTPEHEQELKESVAISCWSEKQKQADINYLFDTMKKNLVYWWD